jgi:Tol biopolymer transport system component
MDENGSNKRQLTSMTTNCMYPKWSSDGKQIVFQTDDNRIFLIREIPESGTVEPYFVFGGTNPSFVMDDELIMFNSDHEFANTIYVMAPNESEAELVATGNYSNQQVLSRDGTKLLYSGFEEGAKSIFLAYLEDSTDNFLRKISVNGDANLEPDMTADAKNFVYAGFDNNLKGTIYVNLNGSEKALTKSMPSATQPKFSPDGSTIGFVVIEGTNVSLYTMDINGSNVKKLRAEGNIGLFKWFDNSTIIYDSESGGNYSIYRIDVKAGGNDVLADGGLNVHPDFLK